MVQIRMDDLTLARLRRMLSTYKETHGRDASHAELVEAGYDTAAVDAAVRKGILTKYQVTAGKGGRVENRYKLAVNWRDLNR